MSIYQDFKLSLGPILSQTHIRFQEEYDCVWNGNSFCYRDIVEIIEDPKYDSIKDHLKIIYKYGYCLYMYYCKQSNIDVKIGNNAFISDCALVYTNYSDDSYNRKYYSISIRAPEFKLMSRYEFDSVVKELENVNSSKKSFIFAYDSWDKLKINKDNINEMSEVYDQIEKYMEFHGDFTENLFNYYDSIMIKSRTKGVF